MDDIHLNIYTPVVTGKPQTAPTAKRESDSDQSDEQKSFSDVLSDTINRNSEVNFSKHAVKRVTQHKLELTEDSISRLNEGVKIASEKNLEEPLILVGGMAFLVNVPNNTVITAINNDDTKGNVFTNIDGTVII